MALPQSRQFTLQLGQSLVQNGGFETGDFPPWTLAGNAAIDGAIYNACGQHRHLFGRLGHELHPFGQLWHMAMGDTNLALLSQTLSTLPGQYYLLSFWLDNLMAGQTPNQFLVNWNTNLAATNMIFYQTNMAAINNWTNMLFILTATGTNTTLQFGAQNNNIIFLAWTMSVSSPSRIHPSGQ